jgi:voltage-gated potassium channel
LLVFASVPAVLIGVGTVGYRFLEGWSWFNSFYVAVITLTSIGHSETTYLSTSGHLFTMALALGGIFTVAVAVTELLSTIITGELRNFWWTWRMSKRIEALEQQVIVCGYGHIGRHVCADLLEGGVPVVVIDRLETALETTHDAGALLLIGDATADATLGRAGIARARALVAVAGTDSDNVLITMTARLLCPLLPIVSCAEEESMVRKLERAGATRVVSRHAIAGGLMAQAVLRPALLDFIEEATGKRHPDLRMEEQLVGAGSPLDGQTVGTSGLRSRAGQVLVAIKRPDGSLAFNPGDGDPVAAGDILITLGSREELGRAAALTLSR